MKYNEAKYGLHAKFKYILGLKNKKFKKKFKKIAANRSHDKLLANHFDTES